MTSVHVLCLFIKDTTRVTHKVLGVSTFLVDQQIVFANLAACLRISSAVSGLGHRRALTAIACFRRISSVFLVPV